MSADGDIVRDRHARLINAYEQNDTDRWERDLHAALARLEAAEAQLVQHEKIIAKRGAEIDRTRAQRDALAEALRTVRAEVELPEHVAALIGAALEAVEL